MSAHDEALAKTIRLIERQYGPGSVLRTPRPNAVSDKQSAVIADIARLAKITSDAKGFEGRFFMLLRGAEQTAQFRTAGRKWADDNALEEAERAIRTACAAVSALSGPQRSLLDHAIYVATPELDLPEPEDTPEGVCLAVLKPLVRAFGVITGRSPHFEPRNSRGRPRATVGDWQFRELVGMLWQTVKKHGGHLSFSCKENTCSGTMVDALELLRPVMPAGLIPIKLPAKTIARVKATLRTQNYWFDFAVSVRYPHNPQHRGPAQKV